VEEEVAIGATLSFFRRHVDHGETVFFGEDSVIALIESRKSCDTPWALCPHRIAQIAYAERVGFVFLSLFLVFFFFRKETAAIFLYLVRTQDRLFCISLQSGNQPLRRTTAFNNSFSIHDYYSTRASPIYITNNIHQVRL
jgi:hypothetical protein